MQHKLNFIRSVCFIFLLLTKLPLIQAQEKEALHIFSLAKYQSGAIQIRWAPNDPLVWDLGNQYGYIVERFDLLPNGQIDKDNQEGILLNPSPARPYSEAKMEGLAEDKDGIAVLYEAIYGESFEPITAQSSPGALLQNHEILQSRYSLSLLVCDLDIEVAKAAGLYWEDKIVQNDHRYIYRISLAQNPSGLEIQPGVVLVDPQEKIKLPVPEGVKVKFADHKATLQWPVFLHQGVYSAYIIERSTDGKNFQSLSDFPIVVSSEEPNPSQAFYVDSLDNNEQMYYYRLRGISAFGEEGPNSEIVSGQGQDDLSGLLVIQSATVINQNQVVLQWQFPDQYLSNLAGFIVKRAPKTNGVYEQVHAGLLDKNQMSFQDQPPYQNNYYQVEGIDENGKTLVQSFPYLAQLEDNTPPIVPQGLQGFVDSLGVVRLTWESNTEKDLKGYRIFSMNSATEEPVEITQNILTVPAFTDTIQLKTLTREIFYQVVAVDQNFNNSDYSVALKLERPDIIPPTQPVFLKNEFQNGEVKLSWVNSTSTDIDYYELFRLELDNKGTTYFISLKKWSPTDTLTEYRDTISNPNLTYQYQLEVYDKSRNKSRALSDPVVLANGFKKAPEQLQAKIDPEQNAIQLSWEYPNQQIRKVIIYRSLGTDNFRLYQSIQGDIKTFTDKDIKNNETYTYRIKVYLADNSPSKFSKAVKVQY